jgi:arylsulfatase
MGYETPNIDRLAEEGMMFTDAYGEQSCTAGLTKVGVPGATVFDDDGNLVALRFDNWKLVFMEQRCEGTLRLWAERFTALRVPKLYNLRTDPFERTDITSNTYNDWFLQNDFLALAAQAVVSDFLRTFKEFPPRQKAASFTID